MKDNVNMYIQNLLLLLLYLKTFLSATVYMLADISDITLYWWIQV